MARTRPLVIDEVRCSGARSGVLVERWPRWSRGSGLALAEALRQALRVRQHQAEAELSQSLFDVRRLESENELSFACAEQC